MRRRKVIIVCKGKIEYLPPIITVGLTLRELSRQVVIICSTSSEATKRVLGNAGIDIIDVCPEYERTSTLFSRAAHWALFRTRAWNLVGKERDSLLWIGSADTCLAMGKKLFQYRYVLHIFELYDQLALYRRSLAKYARASKRNVVPEQCRASIFRTWYNLRETPSVLPNKPLQHPRLKCVGITQDREQTIMSELSSKTIILYQGHICPGRDLTPLATASLEFGNSYCVVLMGMDMHNLVKSLQAINPSIVHIPHIQAPHHLEITSHADIGVITYDFDSLNSIFCAPNKLWEYAGFGIPMLCRNLPSLIFSVAGNRFGECIEFTSDNIIESIKSIEANYEEYSINARDFYDSIDIRSLVDKISSDS